MTIPDTAIDAAAKALGQVVPNYEGVLWEYDNPEDGQRLAVTVDEVARAAIEAAMPAIREAIAQEIEAIPTMESVIDKDGDPVAGLSTMVPPFRVKEEAARIVRGGTS